MLRSDSTCSEDVALASTHAFNPENCESQPETHSPKKSLRGITDDDLPEYQGSNEPKPISEATLAEGGSSVLYGPSNCGKSFWIVDLGAAVASGRNFRDELEVDGGAVTMELLSNSLTAEMM